ncbi:unnamed protein product [Notodromas monacha]|uniref:Cytosol aminopeptidase n=1 Tax=Notodromas monacha TaxID=399045 RepID=A0A7R9BDH7_9CRUS|nr:unnamed protein product [Notodromas monacha]CAG0912638.1 unnamed protein product [Notodromas monacha]
MRELPAQAGFRRPSRQVYVLGPPRPPNDLDDRSSATRKIQPGIAPRRGAGSVAEMSSGPFCHSVMGPSVIALLCIALINSVTCKSCSAPSESDFAEDAAKSSYHNDDASSTDGSNELVLRGAILGFYSSDGNFTLTQAASTLDVEKESKISQYLHLSQATTIKSGGTRVLWNFLEGYDAIVLANIGEQNRTIDEEEQIDPQREAVRKLIANAFKSLWDAGSRSFSHIDLDTMGDPEAAAESIYLVTWVFNEFKKSKTGKPEVSPLNLDALTSVLLVNTLAPDQRRLRQNFARYLTEMPASLMTPTAIGEEAKKMLDPLGVQVACYNRSWIEAEKMGSFLSVAAGNPTQPPVFLEMIYTGDESENPPIVLVAIGEEAKKMLDPLGVQVACYNRSWIEAEKMGSFLSVAAGNPTQPPVFLEMIYTGDESENPPIVLVGKGITYDSGGVSLKTPGHSMMWMRGDMAGGAVVIGTIKAIAKLKLRVNVVGLVPLTENMIGGTATKVMDVVTAKDGQTIEIVNTDAEGRLVLADALVYAGKFNPKVLVDLATLTGGIISALASSATGTFATHTREWNAMLRASISTGDRVWRMPLWDYYRNDVAGGHLADLMNFETPGAGGMANIAAAFLREFVPKNTSWIHMDIANVMRVKSSADAPYYTKGFTGRPARPFCHNDMGPSVIALLCFGLINSVTCKSCSAPSKSDFTEDAAKSSYRNDDASSTDGSNELILRGAILGFYSSGGNFTLTQAASLLDVEKESKISQYLHLAQATTIKFGGTRVLWNFLEGYDAIVLANIGEQNRTIDEEEQIDPQREAVRKLIASKGITYDSGGVSLKIPSESMMWMRGDMAGGAVVIGTIKAIAELKLRVNVVGLVPLTENMIGGTATKVMDVVTAKDGQTIEITNTDAEGRLVLADALVYAGKFNPKVLVDLATLTGGIVKALASSATGTFATHTREWNAMLRASISTGDRVWRMPLWDFYRNDVAGICSKEYLLDSYGYRKRHAGEVFGGCTLHYKGIHRKTCSHLDSLYYGSRIMLIPGSIPVVPLNSGSRLGAQVHPSPLIPVPVSWIHMDIANVMRVKSSADAPYITKGFTGRPARTLIRFIMDHE